MSVLHGRCAEVRQLAFHSGAEGTSRVTAEVTLANAGSSTLQASLARNVEAVQESVRRIRTIALVHETLSREAGYDFAFI